MTNLKDNAAAASRTTVRIPTASGDELEAWLYLPAEDGPHPAVVMAHGIGGVKAGGPPPVPGGVFPGGVAPGAVDHRPRGGPGRPAHGGGPQRRRSASCRRA